MNRNLIITKSYSHTFHIVLNFIYQINNILYKTEFYIELSKKNYIYITSIKTIKIPINRHCKTIYIIDDFFFYLINIYNLYHDLFIQTSILWALKENVKKPCEKLLSL